MSKRGEEMDSGVGELLKGMGVGRKRVKAQQQQEAEDDHRRRRRRGASRGQALFMSSCDETEGDDDGGGSVESAKADEGDEEDEEEDDEDGEEGAEAPARPLGRVSALLGVESESAARKRRRHEVIEVGGARSWRELELPSSEDTRKLVAAHSRLARSTTVRPLLRELCRSQLPMDLHLLQRGYNLLYCGLGSKKELLELIAAGARKQALDRGKLPPATLVVDGFAGSAGAQLRATLATVLTSYLGLPASAVPANHRALERSCAIIAQCATAVAASASASGGGGGGGGGGGVASGGLARQPGEGAPAWQRGLLVVVHNLDGELLRGGLGALATLAAAPRVQLVASVDHVHAMALLEQRFNFVMRLANTMQPYLDETAQRPREFANSASSAEGAQFVLKSLTQNHKDVLQVLAQHQLHEDRHGMSYQALYEACSSDMTVSSDAQLRRLLVEFKDHRIVSSRRLATGRESLYITWEPAVIESVLLS